jgi:hypothetical protein
MPPTHAPLRPVALALACATLLPAAQAQTPDRLHYSGFEPVGFAFFEPFDWSGNHASRLDSQNSSGGGHHHGATVWWNEDHWDVGGDTSYNAAMLQPGTTGYHVDVHKSASTDPRDGNEDNTVVVIGGDGSRGVAAMRLDFEGISTARLRNPMLVSAQRPGTIDWYAPAFVTTAHWWEIALTPASGAVTSGINTSVPALVARPPFEDSLNFVAIGYDDIPCETGWFARFDVHRTVGGVTTEYLMDFPGNGTAGFPPIDPTRKMVLTHWRLRVHPDRIEFFADLDGNEVLEPLQTYPVGVPWPEVHVALLGVAYQADHHPQGACYQGLTRELVWRDVRVEPVKYATTSSAPRNELLRNVQRETGWLGYDLRDIQRFGPAVDGAAQANAVKYVPWGHMAFASRDLTAWDVAQPPVPEITLPVTLDAAQAGAAAARLVYDTKDHGSATLYVNGTLVGALPGADSLRYDAQFDNGIAFEWVRRSIDVPPALLQAGANQLRIVMSGNVVMDRLQLEFMH